MIRRERTFETMEHKKSNIYNYEHNQNIHMINCRDMFDKRVYVK